MNTNTTSEGQLSTRELLESTFRFFRLIGTNWRLWTAALLLGAILSLLKDSFTEKKMTYRATILFNLELGGGNGASQLGGLASAFGLGGGNTASSGELFTSQNFPTIVRSRAVMERALMKTVVVDGDSLLMINYIKDSSDIKTNEWGGDLFHAPFQKAIDYKFKKKEIKDFTQLENKIIYSIFDKVREATEISNLKTTNSIMVLTSLMTNERMVQKWVEVVLETTEEFYVEMKTAKTRELLRTQGEELAKIENQLYSSDNKLSRINFQSPIVVDPRGKMIEAQVSRKSGFLTTQYVNLLNSIEGLNRVLLEQTPIFTIMEETRLPLENQYTQTGLGLKISSFAFMFLAIVAIILVDLYKRIMQ